MTSGRFFQRGHTTRDELGITLCTDTISQNRDYKRDPYTTPIVQPMWDVHSGGKAGTAQKDSQIQQYHKYAATKEGCENIIESGGYGVYIIQEGGGISGVRSVAVQIPRAYPGPDR